MIRKGIEMSEEEMKALVEMNKYLKYENEKLKQDKQELTRIVEAYKEKEDKIREYIEELKKEKWQNDRTDYMLGMSYVGTKVLQILNEGDK